MGHCGRWLQPLRTKHVPALGGGPHKRLVFVHVHPAVCQRGGCYGEGVDGQWHFSTRTRRPWQLPAGARRGGSAGGFAFRGSCVSWRPCRCRLALRGRHVGGRQSRRVASGGACPCQAGPGHAPAAGIHTTMLQCRGCRASYTADLLSQSLLLCLLHVCTALVQRLDAAQVHGMQMFLIASMWALLGHSCCGV